jgi:hypothetical protein
MNQDLKVTISRMTDPDFWRKAVASTAGGRYPTKTTWAQILASEHSPIRAQWYWVEFDNLYSYVSVHMVRHKIGVEPFVQSKRKDRGGTGEEGRYTPVLHSMMINAQALMTQARVRLCNEADVETRHAWELLKQAVAEIDPELAALMVPLCIYRNGKCEQLGKCPRKARLRGKALAGFCGLRRIQDPDGEMEIMTTCGDYTCSDECWRKWVYCPYCGKPWHVPVGNNLLTIDM